MNRNKLYDRINRRVDRMRERGLKEEVKALRSYRELKALQTVGYSEYFSYFEGEITEEETIRLIKRNSRRYAKRQITWYRRNAEKWNQIAAENADEYCSEKAILALKQMG